MKWNEYDVLFNRCRRRYELINFSRLLKIKSQPDAHPISESEYWFDHWINAYREIMRHRKPRKRKILR